ncbi:hypothetical protein FT663_02438 [Candidozyma haemuli var. vulneris]|uniref:enoyl-[acyl-carrier-protein] reductase n=1 Tax=Candidozyma haemuli TaxID=45357 RepID=A0A2V1AQG8_9ASCO|nr:hypothetical protein CXQ85_001512 [[Candida] haemuloni]KAF3992121.1 hypothetical protein FT663_02438 [[Candida] haemuloni var. vulneris]KAF3992739.1 hypothetical protein FT662_00948 [[Candida] haemuloni var. vulneris]PVH19211.1 hypothetical protein CXQ85_001512 [[Candida] haemuloni]
MFLSAGKSSLRAQLRTPYSPISRMLTSHAVIFSSHGEPKDVLKTHTYEIDETKLGANEIVLKTLGAPINPSDINQVQGVYPSQPEKTTALGTSEPSAVGGNEGLFEITHVGSGVKEFQVGDWAIPTSVNFGTWRSYALCDAEKMMKVPNPDQSKAEGKKQGLSINQGATLSVNPLTAYLMLTHYVKLTPGKDWFIQNGGNSAVGKFASQIAKLLGFNSLSVVRDRSEIEDLKKDLKEVCGATQVITEEQNNSKEFGPQVKQWLKESGGEIKLALNCVGGKSSAGVARKLAPNGLMLTYGGMSFQPVTLPTSLHIFKNITSAGFWVTELLKSDPNLKRETVDRIVDWYTNGELLDAPSHENVWGNEDLAKVVISGVENSKSGKQLVKF